MGEHIAQAVSRPAHAGHHDMVAVILAAQLVAAGGQQRGRRGHGLLQITGKTPLGLVMETAQGLGLHLEAEVAHVPQHRGAIAVDADGHRYQQEAHDAQEPEGAVDVVQAEGLEDFVPEGPELDDVVLIGLVLLENGADHRGNGNRHQQGDGQIHGAEEFQQHRAHGSRRPAGP